MAEAYAMPPTRHWSPGRTARIALACAALTSALYLFFLRGSAVTAQLASARHSWPATPFSGAGEDQLQAHATAAAGNRTLGLDSLHVLNLPARFDRADAMALQAFLSGLDVTEQPGVDAEAIHDLGMPPAHTAALAPQAKGCWRAHANIWAMMLRKSLPAVLIMEADAAWDLHIRDIMANFSKHFTQFLRQINSTALPRPGRNAPHSERPPPPRHPPTIEHNPNDPLHSDHWDILLIGHCEEHDENHEASLVFPDPYARTGFNYYGRTLGKERVVRKSGATLCTTSYAISPTGAAKLLLRSALDLDSPIDNMIRQMVLAGDLVAYSVNPMVIVQWKYEDDIGMEMRKANSDIDHNPDNAHVSDEETQGKAWQRVFDSGAVWMPKYLPGYEDTFEHFTLQEAWRSIMGNSSMRSSLA